MTVCSACHGADGNSRIPGVPSLAGQPALFLENYLVLTREGIAGTEIMRSLLKGVGDRDIVALARHYAALPVKPESSPTDKSLFERGREVAAGNRCGG